MTRRVTLAVVSALMGVLACGDGPLQPAPITSVGDAMVAWEVLGLSSYRVDVRKQCFCSPDAQKWYEVRVSNHRVESVWPLEPVDPSISSRPYFPTVTEVYDQLREAPQPSSLYRGEFDPRTGLPLKVWLGYPSADDSGVYYEFRNLRAGTSQQ
jgi:hypothetical protein